MNDQPTPCLTRHDIFLSPHPQAHEVARPLCLGDGVDVPPCPRLAWCKSEARHSLELRPNSLEGTWAGVLYVDKRRRQEVPDDMADDEFEFEVA